MSFHPAAYVWAIDITPPVFVVIVIVGIGLLGVAWFAVKFWLASTRPPNIKEIQTPNLDRLNQRALESMANDEHPDDDTEDP